ncbi:MAG: anthranilate synthase component I, partial [Thermodesulfobacterium geofontis]
MEFSVYPSKSEFLKLIRKYNLIPVWTDLLCDLDTPISLFYKVFKNEYGFLLESVEGAEKWARYSFIGIEPFLIFKSKGKRIDILEKTKSGFSKKEIQSENAFLELKKLIKQFKTPDFKELPRFSGGAVGFVSYESVRFFENIPCGKDTLSFSDLHFMFPEILLVHDRLSHTLKLIYNIWKRENEKNPKELYDFAFQSLKELKEIIYKERVLKEDIPLNYSISFSPEISKEEFLSMVKKAKKYIENGDVIQVVLSQRFFLESEISPFLIYRALRKVNPSPYLFYLKLGDEVLIGSSPEILVRMEGDIIETRPIAGTRKRGKTEEEDKKLEMELRQDEKELAEHIMLVDLGRNDIGRVCKYGSVEVYELMVVERYSHVMHLVSGVRGKAKDGIDMFDTFSATFPAG